MRQTKLTEFHWHEALDRAFVAMDSFNQYVAEHPAIEQTAALKKQAGQISELMYRLHNSIPAEPDKTAKSRK